MRISQEYLGNTSPVVPDGFREILHDYVVSLHEYSNGRGYPDDFSKKTDEALDAILALHRAEIERIIPDKKDIKYIGKMTEQGASGETVINSAWHFDGYNQCISDIRQRAEGTK